MSKVKVAVRVRPLNHREHEAHMKSVVDMRGNQTILTHRKKGSKTFAYDHCFLSTDEDDPRFAGQEHVFEHLGVDVLDNAFEGYNACIFAYGQTGSGKSYTMMGGPGQKGVIPRLCDILFDRIQKNDDSRLKYTVEVSYMEIYNERVRDLLDPRGGKNALKVREHASLGPYVDGLSKLAVKSFGDIDSLMSEGNKSRTVASTNMNSESSRSHAVFTVIMTQTMFDPSTMAGHEKVSRISLVDLAGSERLSKTGAEGDRLKEGSNINRSLTTLGLVISSLADQSSGKAKKSGFVPYRDSVLTWLLKDSLGGNSKTVMVATVSPADDNYEETLSTLRYADRAKRIVNHAIINEDPNAKVIRELREELDRLRSLLTAGTQGGVSVDEQKAIDDMREKLAISERLMAEMTMTWEEKLSQTERIHKERHKALEEMGISIQAGGIGVESGKFYLVNLNADPSLNELLVYYLRDHNRVGRPDPNRHSDIQLMGLGILPEHCFLDIEERDLFITPAAPNARTFVNGHPVTEKTLLYQGDRILWGNNHFFRVSCDRKRESTTNGEETTQLVDYDFARKEIAMYSGDVDSVVKSLEEKHTADKQGALNEQKAMYEKKLAELRDQMSSQQSSIAVRDSISPETTLSAIERGSKSDLLNDDDDEQYSQEEISRLKDSIICAMELVREANILAEEMHKLVKFKVSLQIPKGCLSPRRRGHPRLQAPNEVVVAVNYDNNKTRNTVWSVMKLEDKLVDMRERYQRLQDGALLDELDAVDPFFDLESHTLIGVANVFLECLHHDVYLEYSPPIIDPRGEVCGRLKVGIKRVQFPVEGAVFEPIDKPCGDGNAEEGNVCSVEISIIETTGLPPELNNFVFCQFNFYDQENVVVAPVRAPTGLSHIQSKKVVFDYRQVFCVPVTDEFVDYIAYGCLSIEVFGHRSVGFGGGSSVPDVPCSRHASRTLGERWHEILRRFEMFVEVMEIDEAGQYTPVDVVERQDNRTGGIFLLKQGQARRIKVLISSVKGSGFGPVAFERITKIGIGAVIFQNKLAISLDSYMDSGLYKLRRRWSEALMRRRAYLDEQIHKTIDKSDRSKEDTERESAWIDEWTNLQLERSAVESPQRGSGVPGAVSARDKHLRPEMEKKICTVFLDLQNELQDVADYTVVGEEWLLDGEDDNSMLDLPIIKMDEKQVSAVASWDSSAHDNVHLNKATSDKDRIYMVLKVTVQMSHPVSCQLVLRKRICMKIYKKSGFGLGTTILKKIGKLDKRSRCGIVYEIAAGIPKQAGMDRPASPDPERMLAAVEDQAEGEVLERYSHGVASVQSILSLDKLRQEVAVKEKLAELGRPLKKLPLPIPPKVLVSLSRADSGMLDTVAIGDDIEDDTVRTPSEARSRGVSPGRLASALSSLDEVSETSHDKVESSLLNVSVVTETIAEIGDEHQETVDEIRRDQRLFSPEIKILPCPESNDYQRTSTPLVKAFDVTEMTEECGSELIVANEDNRCNELEKQSNEEEPIDVVTSHVAATSHFEPMHEEQVSHDKAVSEDAGEQSEASVRNPVESNNSTLIDVAAKSDLHVDELKSGSFEAPMELKDVFQPFPVECQHPVVPVSVCENTSDKSEIECTALEAQISQSASLAVQLESNSCEIETIQLKGNQPQDSQFDRLVDTQSSPQLSIIPCQSTVSSETDDSQALVSFRPFESEGQSSHPTTDQENSTIRNEEATYSEEPVKSYDVESEYKSLQQVKIIEEQPSSPKNEICNDNHLPLPNDVTDRQNECLPNQVIDNTDEHVTVQSETIDNENIVKISGEEKEHQGMDAAAVEHVVTAHTDDTLESNSKEEAANVIVKTKSNGEVLEMEDTTNHDIEEECVQGSDHWNDSRTSAAVEPLESKLEVTSMHGDRGEDKTRDVHASHVQSVCEKQVDEKAEPLAVENKEEKTVAVESSKQTCKQVKVQPTSVVNKRRATIESVQKTADALFEHSLQRSGGSLSRTKKHEKAKSFDHKQTALKQKMSSNDTTRNEKGKNIAAGEVTKEKHEKLLSTTGHRNAGLKWQKTRDEGDRSGSEKSDMETSVTKGSNESLKSLPTETRDVRITRELQGARAETLSEASDSSSVASSTDLLDEVASQRHVSDTPTINSAVFPEAAPRPTVTVGEVVMADLGKQGYKMGVVKFVGETEFQPGEWIGIQLDRPNGKHNGSVLGVSYFKCKPKHGVFVRMDKIIKAPDLSSPKPGGVTLSSTTTSQRSPATTRRLSTSSRQNSRAAAAPYKYKRSGLK
ncbi:kinesin-like protein KIF13A isoform X2 [Corticium candelabrum]|uniref:kinesin-like protein KIF13A isoform X2 n=2 Tax=Corticium candelabrum TaxID=121492 RepID=UPI002E25ADD0|nr:kinesin-like protein KIF13A isoform X2 [Corticium candelabrum]